MSRSYKKFPYCNYHSTKVKKEIRRHYNHRLRQLLKNPEIQCNGSQFKKWNCNSWDLFCGSYYTLENYLAFKRATSPPYYHSKKRKFIDEYDEVDAINHWKKWYYRK